jgi:hypothetical protein
VPGGALSFEVLAVGGARRNLRSRSMTSAEERDAERAIGRLVRSFGSTSSYGLVVVMIVATYIVAVAATESWGVTLLVIVQIATVWLTLHTSHASRPLRQTASVLFVLAAVAGTVHFFGRTEQTFLPLVFVASGLLYFFAPFTIVRHVAFRRDVDRETLLGALSAYLFLGMAFALSYRFIGEVQNGPFFGAQGEGTIADDLFFSFVTLTTTGYGNLVPEDNPGQSIALLEALMGQLFLVIAVAKIVNAWTPKRWSRTDTTE